MRTLRIVSSQNRSGRSQDKLNWVWLWVLVWLLALCRVAGECPKVCECKWKDGKQTVSCIGAEFIDIPRRLDPSTQVLDLMQNNLKILSEHAFANTGLVNLQKLWLTYCNLQQLDRGAFNMLDNLVELDLSHNLLRGVPSGALGDIPGLRELRIARNALTSIPAEAFTPTPDLVRLDLSSNRIYALHYHAFRGLASLEVLKLSGNMLVHMGQEVLVPLMALHGLHLNDNPWQCDCRLRPLRQWMINNNIAGLVPPLCARPRRLSSRSWNTLTLDEFVCVPHVSAVVSEVIAAKGENVSIACRVETDMKADVTWFLGDKPLANATDAWRYKVLGLVSLNHSSILSNLTVTDASEKDQGTYRCVAENKAGSSETNITLQVSENSFESSFIFFDTTYMVGGLLSGLGFLITILLLVSCVAHRRQRVRLFKRQEEERGRAALTPQTSIVSQPQPPATTQPKTSNYQSSNEKAPLHSSHSKHSRSSRDNSNGSYSRSSYSRYHENSIDDMRGHRRLSHNNIDRISYLELPICDLQRSRGDIEDKISLKNLEFETDILRRECSPTGSVVSVVSNGPYPDMVDITYPRTSSDFRSDFQAYDSSYAHRSRKFSHHSYEDPRLDNISYDRTSLDGRCYSDLNLALGEDSYEALSHRIGRRRAIRYPSLPSTPMMGHDETSRINTDHDARRLRRIMAAHRGKYHSLEGTSELSAGNHYRYNYHAAKLDKFLKDYRGLQAQIYRRKQSIHRPGSSVRLSASDTLDGTGSCRYKETTVPHPPYMEVDLGLSHRRALPSAKNLLSSSQGVGGNKGGVLPSSERRRSMVQVGNLTHSDSVIEAMQGRALTPTDYMIEVMQNTDVVPPPGTTKSLIDSVSSRDIDDQDTMREMREAMQERDLSPTESVIDVMKGRILRSSESLPVIQRRKRSSTDSRMDSSSEEHPPRQTEPLRSILKNRYEGGGLLYSGGQYPQSAYYDAEGNIDGSYSSDYKDYLDHES